MDTLPHHVLNYICSKIEHEPTRDTTRWCVSMCNKELFLTLCTCLNPVSFLNKHQVQNAQLSEDCVCMLLDMNCLRYQLNAWSEKAAHEGWTRFLRAMINKGGSHEKAVKSIFVFAILVKKRRLDIIMEIHPLCWHDNNDEMVFEHCFHVAFEQGYTELVRWMYSHHPGAKCDRCLDFAVSSGDLEWVKYVHENHIYKNTHGCVELATMSGHYDILRYILDHNMDKPNFTAMESALIDGRRDLVNLLLEYGYEPTEYDMVVSQTYKHTNIQI